MPMGEHEDELPAQGAIADDDSGGEPGTTTRSAPPIGRGSPHWPTKAVRERRVTHVFGLLVAGRQRWQITEDIATAQAEETAARAAARETASAAGSANPDVDALAKVPLVWGPEPIPARTLDDYVRRAKAILKTQSGEFVSQRAQALAVAIARINETYDAATKAGRHYAALKANELLIELLDLRGYAKTAALTAELPTKEPGAGEEGSDEPRLLPTDPTARASAFADLVAQSVKADPTLREELASLVPRTTVMP
jgi:hypothetical protein